MNISSTSFPSLIQTHSRDVTNGLTAFSSCQTYHFILSHQYRPLTKSFRNKVLRKDSLTEVSAWIQNVNKVFSKARITENWRVFGKSHLKWLLSPSQLHGLEASQHLRFQIQIKAVCDTAWAYILTVPDFKILLNFINSLLTSKTTADCRYPAPTSTAFNPSWAGRGRAKGRLKKVTPTLHTHGHIYGFQHLVPLPMLSGTMLLLWPRTSGSLTIPSER